MSYAVPCAGVVIGSGSPPCTVTPLEKPSSLIAIWPWSWYIVTIASNSPSRALMNSVSAGNGPWAGIPASFRARTAGAMMSISSRPQVPPSPPCGLKAATATRGAATPLARSERVDQSRGGDDPLARQV